MSFQNPVHAAVLPAHCFDFKVVITYISMTAGASHKRRLLFEPAADPVSLHSHEFGLPRTPGQGRPPVVLLCVLHTARSTWSTSTGTVVPTYTIVRVPATHASLTVPRTWDGQLLLHKRARCYTETAPNARHRRVTQKTGNTYNQPKRPSTGTPHRPSTRHNRKGSPGVKTHNTNQHSSRARLQHSNHPPPLPTHNRVITRSFQPTQPATKHRRAEPHYNTDTTRLSGDTQRPPPGGPLSGQPKAHGQPPGRGRGRGGGMTEEGKDR